MESLRLEPSTTLQTATQSVNTSQARVKGGGDSGSLERLMRTRMEDANDDDMIRVGETVSKQRLYDFDFAITHTQMGCPFEKLDAQPAMLVYVVLERSSNQYVYQRDFSQLRL